MSDKVLESIWYDPSHPAGFSSVRKLYDAVKVKGFNLEQVKTWLKTQVPYTLHRQARRRFKRNPIIVSKIDEQWEADLVDMQEFKRHNNGHAYILTIIDCFSKYAMAYPLKNKSGPVVRDVFAKIFKKRFPNKLRTDQGKEFINAPVQNLLTDYKITFITSKDTQIKCSMVERFNRTLKGKMYKYFTAKGTKKFIDVLPKLIDSYNNTKHRITKFKPIEISNENSPEVFRNVYGFDSLRELLKSLNAKVDIKVGDKVRLKYQLGPFDKGFYPNWTDNIYIVHKVLGKNIRPLFVLKEQNGEILDRRYYPEEIQKVEESVYRVEKIIKRRKRGGVAEYFVKWMNYPSSYNSWITSDDLVKL